MTPPGPSEGECTFGEAEVVATFEPRDTLTDDMLAASPFVTLLVATSMTICDVCCRCLNNAPNEGDHERHKPTLLDFCRVRNRAQRDAVSCQR